MSAIGSYVVLRRDAVDACAARAAEIRTVAWRRWLLMKETTVGREEFARAWARAVAEEEDFELSGYVLGSYLDAQQELNDIEAVGDDTALGRALAKVFTGVFVFEAPQAFPELPPKDLAAWCREDAGDEADDLLIALSAAHAFVARGLAKVDEKNLVAFIIR